MSGSKLTFPNVQIGVQDNSGAGAVATNTITPLHLPLFFIQAEKGPINTPVIDIYANHLKTFGAMTFDPTQKFFNHQTLFAQTAANSQKVCLVRVADNTITQASLVLLVTLTPTQLTQYQTDSLGNIITDSSGNPVPQTTTGGVIVQQPGYTLTWSTRPLAAGETISTVNTVTTQISSGVDAITYPILATQAYYAGSAVNRQGFRFYYDPNVSVTTESDIQSAMYAFAPVVLANNNSGIVSPVQDIYLSNYNDVSLKSAAVDPSTAQDMSLNGILLNNYTDLNGNPLLDYQVYTYSSNVSAAGSAILALSPELQTLNLTPFQVNIVSCVDKNGNPYFHAVVDSTGTTVVNQNVVLYNQGGSDGAISVSAFESQLEAALSSNTIDGLTDYFRFPISHVYDSGFSLSAKYALMSLFSMRDDVVLDFSTQDMTVAVNTAAQDQSSGAALLARIRTNPESVDFGTGAIRANIYQQVGLLAVPGGWYNYTAATLDRLIKRTIYYSGTTVKGTPKGRPNSVVSVFKKMNWTESTITQKQLNWDTSLNTISYADQNTLFYPDLQTVYADKTSLLSDSVFVDYIVFIKHIVRDKWTYYVGRNDNPSSLYTTISNDIDKTLFDTFGTYISTKTSITQTDADLKNGFSDTVTVAVQGNMPGRIWNVVIPVSRQPSSSTTTSTTTSTVG